MPLVRPNSTVTTNPSLWAREWRVEAERFVSLLKDAYYVQGDPTPERQTVTLLPKTGEGPECVLPLTVIRDLLAVPSTEKAKCEPSGVIEGPTKKKAHCAFCGAVTAYTQLDVWDRGIENYSPVIKCVACKAIIAVSG